MVGWSTVHLPLDVSTCPVLHFLGSCLCRHLRRSKTSPDSTLTICWLILAGQACLGRHQVRGVVWGASGVCVCDWWWWGRWCHVRDWAHAGVWPSMGSSSLSFSKTVYGNLPLPLQSHKTCICSDNLTEHMKKAVLKGYGNDRYNRCQPTSENRSSLTSQLGLGTTNISSLVFKKGRTSNLIGLKCLSTHKAGFNLNHPKPSAAPTRRWEAKHP